MKYLLDINALLAAILTAHSKHSVADAWVNKEALDTGIAHPATQIIQ